MGRQLGGGCAPLGRGAGCPSNTTWPGPRPTRMSGFILIRPTVWPQYMNVTDRQTGQWSFSIGRTVFTNGHPKIKKNCNILATVWPIATKFGIIMTQFDPLFSANCYNFEILIQDGGGRHLKNRKIAIYRRYILIFCRFYMKMLCAGWGSHHCWAKSNIAEQNLQKFKIFAPLLILRTTANSAADFWHP